MTTNNQRKKSVAAGQGAPTVFDEQDLLNRMAMGAGLTMPDEPADHAVQTLRTVSAPSVETTEPPQASQPAQSTPQAQPVQPARITARHRRGELDEYRQMFMQTPKITDRQPVFVSREIRDRIDSIVRRLGERKMSVSGFLENLARHHLDLYADDLEQWKRL